jgi:methionyl-tRNA formyltransferase
MTPTPIEDVARGIGIDVVLAPERLRDAASVDAILALRPRLAVLADYGQIVPSTLLDLESGALNLHPSLLPRHRGATPIPAAILAGDRETGVTLIRMDEGLDTGPIVAQRSVPLDGTETASSLEAELRDLAATVLDDSVGPWLRGELPPRPQAEDGVSLTRPLRREDGRLDPERPAALLERQVRAYQPWPGSFVDTIAGRMVVWDVDVPGGSIDGEDRTPGHIGGFGMYAADGVYLRFLEVQPAGGHRMAWQDFIRGRPAVVGSAVVRPS